MPFHSMTNTIIFSSLLAVSVASAATYYVDAAHGDDKAAGTSAAAAWRSIARVNAQAFKPGDTILFKRGNIFRGQTLQLASGELGKPITYSAYGEGHKPIIQPSLDFNDPAKWEACGENLWRTKTNLANSIKTNGPIMDLRTSDWGLHVEKPASITYKSKTQDGRKTRRHLHSKAVFADRQIQHRSAFAHGDEAERFPCRLSFDSGPAHPYGLFQFKGNRNPHAFREEFRPERNPRRFNSLGYHDERLDYGGFHRKAQGDRTTGSDDCHWKSEGGLRNSCCVNRQQGHRL